MSLIKISELPIKISDSEAIDIAYKTDVLWSIDRILQGESVLLELEKTLYPYIYQSFRRRLKDKNKNIFQNARWMMFL